MTPEEENTFRALKELPLAATSFWCRLGWHQWTKWTAPREVIYKSTYALDRYCVHCHLPDTAVKRYAEYKV